MKDNMPCWIADPILFDAFVKTWKRQTPSIMHVMFRPKDWTVAQVKSFMGK